MTSFVHALTFAVLAVSLSVTVILASDDQLILYDVSKVNKQDVINAFAGLPVKRIFKQAAVDRYFVVVENDEAQPLQDLSFPKGVKVTEYPLGNVCDFLSTMGFANCTTFTDDDFTPDVDMVFAKLEIRFPPTTEAKEVRQRLRAATLAYVNKLEKFKTTDYKIIGKFPPRTFLFTQAPMSVVQNLAVEIAALAGPGNVVINVLPILEVPNQQ